MSHGPFDGLARLRGEIAELIRTKDWTGSPIGPIASWPPALLGILRLMLTSRYAMWLGWGPDLTFFYNDSYRDQTLGAKHPWALGQPASVVWREIWDQVGPRIESVFQTGEATWDEGLLLFLERNGYPEETYHTFSYSPALDDDGITRGLFCVVIEETERVIGQRRMALLRDYASELATAQTTEDVLRATERTLAKDTRDITFTLAYLFDDSGGPQLRLGALEDAEAIGHGLPLEEARSIQITLPARSTPWPAGVWKQPSHSAIAIPIVRAGQAVPAGFLVAGLNPHRPLDDGYRGFLDLLVGQLAAALDNARAYESEKKRAEALAQLDRAKTAFFSNVSHEFRTPLTLMIGPTEDALAAPERALVGESLDIVHRNELRLLKLVNALLDFSRIEAGRVEARFEETDLAALTRELASAFESAMTRGGLDYRVELAPLAGPAWVDHDMWEKIVLNLLSNALKFTMEGHVRVALREVDAFCELLVEDSGAGIPEAEVPRLFERFHRIEGTRARTHEGSGIGLALVRDLVELHGGSISATSRLGEGTTFRVRVPKGRAHLPPERVVESRGRTSLSRRAESFVTEALRWLPSATVPPPRTPSSPPRSAQRILVADDNADMREYVARLLGARWEVETVSDGEAALAAIRARAPDLVVSDVMMPRLDGFALVQKVRADPTTRTVPIILLSARAGEEATADGLRSGANDYVIKPFSARELIVRVASQLDIARIRREAEEDKEAQRRVVQTLFEHAPAGIALIRGPEQVIEFANPMALEIWGRTAEVVGKPLLEALPELRGKGFDALLRDVVRTGIPYAGDEAPVMFTREDGATDTRYLKFVYTPAANERGVVDGAAAFAFDVTTQVVGRQRAALGATLGRVLVSGADLESQLRSCCDALVAFGAMSAALWTSNEGNDLLELRAVAGMPSPPAYWSRLSVGQGRIGEVARRRHPVILEESVEDFVLEDSAPAGPRKTGGFAAYPLCVRDRLLGVLALSLERAPDEALLQTLSTASDQIALGIDRENGERFRELFIGVLGHDLRNPLSAVNMATHLLVESSLNPSQHRKVARIRASANRMSRMITQVLDFTRARAGGGIPIAREPVDLRTVCAHAVEELAIANPERRIDARYEGSAHGTFDDDRLAQVFSNLIGNALGHGRPDGTVRVVLDGSGSSVIFTVHNEGAPIPAALMGWLFDPFRRAAHGKSEGTQGLGLGLFIAQQIVLAHRGSITVHSTLEEGTTFRVELPRTPEEKK